MTRAARHDDRHPWSGEDLAAFVLGELPEAEAEALEAHLRACPSCRDELEALDATYVTAIETLPADAPPASTWDGVAAKLAVRGVRVDATRPDAGASRNAPVRPSTPAPSGRASGRRRSFASWPLAAAVVALAAVGGWGAWQRQAANVARAEVAALEARVALLEDAVGTVRARADELETFQATLAAWLANDEVVTARLAADGDGASAGTVLFRPDGRVLVVMRDAPAEGRDFQAWAVRDGEVASLGAFGGRTLDVDAGAFDAVAVSLEPDGGSATPTEVLGSASPG